MRNQHTVIIGAGMGGLTTAALLLNAGHRVTVVEAHIYPGGCAGTFYHQGYRFDAGATLAGGFAPGGPHARIAELLDLEWPVRPVDPAWVTHLPDRSITQWADVDHWREERRAAFPGTEKFWRTQESLADIAWDISSRPFPWPPQSVRDWATLAPSLRPSVCPAIPYVFSSIGTLVPTGDPLFKTFLDAQLLISAQTTSEQAQALYGSAALDLPRRGVNHVRGGSGGLAKALADWIRARGGEVLYRQRVERIEVKDGRAIAARTDKGLRVECDALIANLTAWALRALLGDGVPASLCHETRTRPASWGAFTLYLGLDASALPADTPDHHQVVIDPARPLGEGNSVFISLSDTADSARPPQGMRAATLSTHTAVARWWMASRQSEPAYAERKAEYTERLLAAAERALPGLRRAIRFHMAGTPVTFEDFTGRPQGMVGGFPQTSLFNVRGPRTSLPNLWLVGDSIFPGQSTAGVALGALRVAADVLATTRATQRVPTPKFRQTLYKT